MQKLSDSDREFTQIYKKKIVSTPLNPGNKNNGWKQKH